MPWTPRVVLSLVKDTAVICSVYAQFVRVTVGSRFMSFQCTVRTEKSWVWNPKLLRRVLRITHKLPAAPL